MLTPLSPCWCLPSVCPILALSFKPQGPIRWTHIHCGQIVIGHTVWTHEMGTVHSTLAAPVGRGRQRLWAVPQVSRPGARAEPDCCRVPAVRVTAICQNPYRPWYSACHREARGRERQEEPGD